MLTESYEEAFDSIFLLYTSVDLKVNEKTILFRSGTNGYSVIFPRRKRVITAAQIKRIIERYNPKVHYSLKLDPSGSAINWNDSNLVTFKKRSFRVNIYGIGMPKQVYEFYKELTKDLMRIYEQSTKF
ncbi:MAG: hypothetical protein QMD12_03485 [Candidatus Aenigmarchaeota archaeon]|nr:hypothetical protein [Candidatus Aenigmarchaeota archaeon]